jgi:hypothetical protein
LSEQKAAGAAGCFFVSKFGYSKFFGYPKLIGVSPKLIGVWNWGLLGNLQSFFSLELGANLVIKQTSLYNRGAAKAASLILFILESEFSDHNFI